MSNNGGYEYPEVDPLHEPSDKPQGEASEELAAEIYEFIDSKVYAWMRREDGSLDPALRQSIIDWITYKLGSHPAPTAEKALRDAFELQKKYYGNATDTHIELSAWACEYAALATSESKEANSI